MAASFELEYVIEDKMLCRASLKFLEGATFSKVDFARDLCGHLTGAHLPSSVSS